MQARIDKKYVMLAGRRLTKLKIDYFKNENQDTEYNYDDKVMKVKDILQELSLCLTEADTMADRLRKTYMDCFFNQRLLFIIGFILIVLFGIFHI